jgi:ABC-type polysaccharide/polyol phosphate transport system ATPase subunit
VAVIDAQSVSKQFLLRHNASVELKVRFLGLLHPEKRQSIEEFWALRDISLRIDHGEAVGLVGRNGSGKSTMLKLIAAIHRPTTGRLLVARGARISSMIELGVGFHPELTGRENVVLNASIHGLTRPEIDRIYSAVVDYSGLEHFIDVPIKNYSSGMHMRLGFAIAANLDPDILLLDEIFAVGDADFQDRCTATVKRFMDEGKTIIFVSHAPSSIRAICRRVCVLEQGALAFDGDVESGLAFYDYLLSRRVHGAGAASPAAPAGSAEDAEADLERAAHRAAYGGLWRETGHWQFELLRQHGLEPGHYVLDVGCGSLSTGIHLLRFLHENRYWGFERNRALLEDGLWIELPHAGVVHERGHYVVNDTVELGAIPDTFDFAVTTSGFAYMPFDSVARSIAGVLRKLKPAGRFFATWFDDPDPASLDPIVHPNGVTTYPDREPYHYPFGLIANVCRAVGGTVERVAGVKDPHGESVMVISRRSERDGGD